MVLLQRKLIRNILHSPWFLRFNFQSPSTYIQRTVQYREQQYGIRTCHVFRVKYTKLSTRISKDRNLQEKQELYQTKRRKDRRVCSLVKLFFFPHDPNTIFSRTLSLYTLIVCTVTVLSDVSFIFQIIISNSHPTALSYSATYERILFRKLFATFGSLINTWQQYFSDNEYDRNCPRCSRCERSGNFDQIEYLEQAGFTFTVVTWQPFFYMDLDRQLRSHPRDIVAYSRPISRLHGAIS